MVDMSRYNKLRINPDRYNYDLATNLPLRRTFWRIADKTVLFDNKTYCILAIDIENFHLINKWYGRETGDELLIEIGEALKSIDAGYGTISGYMGGDNFCVIFEENDDVINLIRKRISGIVNGYRGHDITRAYYGAYKTADKDITTGEMCDYAYGALEIAKQRPDKDIFWYDDSMAREQEAEAKLMPEICSAMDNGEFTFYLQPKCILQTGKIIGSEALVRWISPEKGFISPGQFIPLLEKNGFINKLDVYIWDKVCQTIRRWLDEGRTVLPISINVSRADIYSMDVVRILKGMIEKYNISTEYIEIEITESAYVENGSVIKDTEKAFKNAGFKILIDDFGSGYSSLNMLKDIDADVLKLDMKFLDLNPENNDKGVSIITAVLDMARQLDIPAIAEGIETDEQLKLLEILGCEYAQGYYYYRPMPISDYEKLVDDKDNVADKLIILKTRKNDKSYLKEITDYFWKIADVDLDTGAYHFIRRTDEPDYVMTPRPKTIAEYADRYIKYGVIHPDDVSLYKEAINLGRIKKQLDEGKERGTYQIRYNMDGTYKWYVFEVTKPTNYSEDNRRVLFTWKEADYQAGAREVAIIEEPIAAAIGAGIDISRPCGNMIVDIGGGTTDIAVISLGGTVVSTSIKIAGDDFDEALVRYMRKKHNLLIGERTAEDIKIKIGSAYPRPEVVTMNVRGRNLVTGLPKTVEVTSEETEEALREATSQIVEAVHSVLEKTPPELASDIADRGIVLTGGGSLLSGLEDLIESKTGINTMTAEDPMTAVAIGTGKFIEFLSGYREE